jgi:glycosyltransferase involved in cell wall biosynthesis
MKITFITGSYPPDVCGVGDYTYRLAEALRLKGVAVGIVHDVDWRLRNVSRLLRRIKALHSDLVHLQYPTIGFGAHLTPQVLSILAPSVITLHEISQVHILRKLSLYPFSMRSRQIIFTTRHEHDYAITWAPWIVSRSSIIQIGSNITALDRGKTKDLKEIVYFGLIRPDKGLEHVITLASLIKSASLPFAVRIIGKPHPNFMDYYVKLRNISEKLPLIWDIDLPDNAVVDLLARSFIAYMPFPDGASERRGSLFALLTNGVATITTRGPQTPRELDDAVFYARDPEHALQLIRQISSDADLLARLSRNGRIFSRRHSWETIASQHVALYEKILTCGHGADL